MKQQRNAGAVNMLYLRQIQQPMSVPDAIPKVFLSADRVNVEAFRSLNAFPRRL